MARRQDLCFSHSLYHHWKWPKWPSPSYATRAPAGMVLKEQHMLVPRTVKQVHKLTHHMTPTANCWSDMYLCMPIQHYNASQRLSESLKTNVPPTKKINKSATQFSSEHINCWNSFAWRLLGHLPTSIPHCNQTTAEHWFDAGPTMSQPDHDKIAVSTHHNTFTFATHC